MDFRVLGPLEVWQDGRRVDVRGARQRALLAALVLRAGEVVSGDRLLEDLWPGGRPSTGMAALRVRVSQLRKALGGAGAGLVTRSPGYVLQLGPEQLDLRRFERLAGQGEAALARADAEAASAALAEALGLWRGPPLSDLADWEFARVAIRRLEELRLAALELRLDADLALGRHARVVAELQELVDAHPLRERLHGQLVLALYRGGRQAEALTAYRAARTRLVDELGLEPGPALRELQGGILAQDPALQLDARGPTQRTILVIGDARPGAREVADLAGALARDAGHEVLLAATAAHARELPAAVEHVHRLRDEARARDVQARAAAFVSATPSADALRLTADLDVALVVIGATDGLLAGSGADASTAVLLADAPCDVAVVAGARRAAPAPRSPVLVPFSGDEHDWAAAELGAWLARATGAPLQLLGASPARGAAGRDASRLLAHASLALQRGLGVAAAPVLTERGAAAILEVAAGASFVVAGLSRRWAAEGVGATRAVLAREAAVPVVLVRRGERPGALAPARALTRFTWSVSRG